MVGVCAEEVASKAQRSSMYLYVYALEELTPACEGLMVNVVGVMDDVNK